MVNQSLLSASPEYRQEDGQAQSCYLPSTNIQFAWDSTSLGYLKTCPRLYQYVMLEGYGESDDNIHLRFGQEYHKALEDFDHLRIQGMGYEDALRETLRLLHERIWQWQPDQTTKAGKYKNRESLIRSVVWYIEKFKDDPAKTFVLENGKPAVELSFRFELPWGPSGSGVSQPYLLSGHLDRVVEYNGALFVMDRKTTTTTLSEYFYSQFDMSNQMTLYTMAAKVVIGAPIKGVIIDAAQLLVDETKFGRSITYRTHGFLDEWTEDLSIWLATAENYALAGYWPKNDTACDKFGGCKFKGICSKDPEVRHRFLTNFKQLEPDQRWNPLKPR